MSELLAFTPKGIYCPPGDFYIDPWKPVDKAIITHAHADHARPGHKNYLAQNLSKEILKQRLGENINLETIAFGNCLNKNGVKLSLHPAGHIPGSAQVRIEYKGKVVVISGDYKTEPDTLCDEFEVVKCHEFITETTFGLPIYQWQPQSTIFQDINDWWKENKSQEKVSIIFAYALGKAQRIMKNLDLNLGKIYTHGAVENATNALRASGIQLPTTIKVTKDISRKEYVGNMVIATPASIGTPWMKKFKPYSTGIASGWMMLRGTRRRKAADRGFVLSDHADWNGLISTVKATGAEKVYATHGYTDVFTKYLNEIGIEAISLDTEFENETLESNL